MTVDSSSGDRNDGEHPFLDQPDRTLLKLSLPVLLSLIAEPLTGLVDTAFVSRLGAESLAALGVGAIVLSSSFWIFNFLGIGTQTEVAKRSGRGDREEIRKTTSLAVSLAIFIGMAVAILGWWCAPPLVRSMGAVGEIEPPATTYLRLRLLGAPAVLFSVAAFGALRGLQDMRTPMAIAIGVNVCNLILDPILIFGLGPFPALEIAGAAIASTISQWLGAVALGLIVLGRIGISAFTLSAVGDLLVVGRDLFFRTSALTLFLLVATRAATSAGAEQGAVHQAIRQVWTFTALFLDAFAVTGQTLVGYFLGRRDTLVARSVAARVCIWSLATGIVLGAGMLFLSGLARDLLVPVEAWGLFMAPWIIASVTQPLNALAFATDGIHWGTGDFRFLRNVVAASTLLCGVFLVNEIAGQRTLQMIWILTSCWIAIRAAAGLLRVWPGLGDAPLQPERGMGE